MSSERYVHKQKIKYLNLKKIRFLKKSTSSGYWINKDRQGNGFITKACIVLIDYALTQLLLENIYITCAIDNIKSQKIPERLSFHCNFKKVLIIENTSHHQRYFISYHYIMSKNEWEIRKNT